MNSYRLLFSSVFVASYLSAAVYAQFPGGGGDRGGGGGRGGFGGGGGGSPDPEMIWNFMGGTGKESINLNDPANQRIRDSMTRRGQAIPPNGILTKTEFKTAFAARLQAAGVTPGAPGAPTVIMQAPPGATTMQPGVQVMQPGQELSPEILKGMMSRYDTDNDGRISLLEAQNGRGNLKDSFTQYDLNRDGFVDSSEYAVYFKARSSGFGGNNSFQSGSQPPQASPSAAWAQATQTSRENRDKDRKKEPEKVQVYRYGGYAPKGLPGWFEELDTDRDGQVGLYEWRTKRSVEDFIELDLNKDGFITSEEWLRKQNYDIAKQEVDERVNGKGNGGSMITPSAGASSTTPTSTSTGGSGRRNPFTAGSKDDKADKKRDKN